MAEKRNWKNVRLLREIQSQEIAQLKERENKALTIVEERYRVAFLRGGVTRVTHASARLRARP